MSYKSSLGRNTTDSRWQWLIVGIVMGFGCAGVACLIAITTGYISLNIEPSTTEVTGSLETLNPTVCGPLDQICGTVGATPLSPGGDQVPPATDEGPPPVSIGDQTPPTNEVAPSPTPTPTNPPPTPTPTSPPLPTIAPLPTEPLVDPRLANIVTELVPVAGGENIEMGTSQAEAALAVQECVNAGGACEIAFAQDSFPVHTVTLSSFQIERYEVNVSQYIAFLNVLGPGSHVEGCGGARCATTQEEDGTSHVKFDGTTYSAVEFVLDRPVTNVTWFGAKTYCEAIGRRLPTEAEWERAARGIDPGSYIYPWGRAFDNTLANTSQSNLGGTMPVDAYPAGASLFGAEQLAGNAAEWVYDWYQAEFYSTDAARQLDTQGPFGGTERVIRGGAWDQRPFFSRAVHRMSAPPNSQDPSTGFRCVSDENPPPTAVPAIPTIGQVETIPTERPTLDPNVTPTPLPTLPPGSG